MSTPLIGGEVRKGWVVLENKGRLDISSVSVKVDSTHGLFVVANGDPVAYVILFHVTMHSCWFFI